MSTPYPITFPVISREWLETCNEVVGSRRQFSLPWKDKAAALQFFLPTPDFIPQWNLRLKIGGESTLLAFGALPDLGSLRADFENIRLTDVASTLQLTVLEAVLEPWMDLLEKSLQLPVEAESLEASSSSPSGPHIFEIELKNPHQGAQLRAQWVLTPALFGPIRRLVKARRLVPADPVFSLPFSGHIILGKLSLTVQEWTQVELNDILLCENHKAEKGWKCRLAFGSRLVYHADLLDKKLTVQTMSTETENTPRAALPPARLDQLPVQLVFEAGQKELSYGELQTLQPGFTFELDATAGSPITIRANGVVVGRGELVQIGERIGVRVQELTGKSALA